jgi:RNA polymerase sigma-70 factor (ECF subfamily)
LDSFEDIYVEYYPVMYGAARKMVGDTDDVADIVQEVFLQFFNNHRNGTVILHPKSWLYRVTLNKSIDHIRKNKRLLKFDEARESAPAEDTFEEERYRAIHAAIRKLKPKEKMLVVLYSENLTYREIAIASGVNFTSVGKMLSRTLKKLEKEMKNQGYEMY